VGRLSYPGRSEKAHSRMLLRRSHSQRPIAQVLLFGFLPRSSRTLAYLGKKRFEERGLAVSSVLPVVKFSGPELATILVE
jgi:hypothetical protein